MAEKIHTITTQEAVTVALRVLSLLDKWACALGVPEEESYEKIMVAMENKAFGYRKPTNAISRTVFNDLLVHGFENDVGVEEILHKYLIVVD
jgi:hypothetical protein